MHRRYERINIPTEIIRTVVVISETGSFSKAGEKLGLSQPAISAQIKRLQIMAGGAVFEKVSGGVTFTPRGKVVLANARKLLEANDQILSLGGTANDSQHLRLGLSTLYVEQFLSAWKAAHCGDQLNFYCDHSAELAKGMADGYLDIACLMSPPDGLGELVSQWTEEYVWVRSREFTLSPGAAIPIVGWPGSLADQPVIQALDKAGAAYRVAFASADHHARITAVAAGIGIMGLPARHVKEPLTISRDYYLPTLGLVSAGICVRSGFDLSRMKSIVEMLKIIMPQGASSQQIA